MPQRRRARRRRGKAANRSQGATRRPSDDGHLLEIGPEDGEDLLAFEGVSELEARIKVVGVGGGGGNALNTMIRSGLGGVEFFAANTDAQALEHNAAPAKIQLGAEVTRGLGCGASPDKGRASAIEARERIHDLLTGADMVFVTAGLGGGTGTGAAPVVAEVAREIGALTVAVVTKPFGFEGRVRSRHAEEGLEELRSVVDTLITIPNNRLLALAGEKSSVRDAFRLADDVLLNAVKGISDLITVHGLVNLDFADVRTIMNEMGMALMGTGIGKGDTRAVDAARQAISSPLLEDLSIDGARGVLINITGGDDLTLYEVNEASTLVQEAAHEDANIIFGAVIDDTLKAGEVRVTVIATGLDDGGAPRGVRRTRESSDLRNVTLLRRETPQPTHEPPAVLQESPSQVEASGEPAPGAGATPDRSETTGGSESSEEWVSPFEDELDVPTFLRRRQRGEDDDESLEDPAFLRRSAD